MTMAADDADATKTAALVTPAQRRALKRLHDAMGSFEAQLQCPICLCAYATPASLPCNHCFCEECIHRALELKQVCPICKAPAKKRQLRHDTMLQQLQQAADLWGSVALAIDLTESESSPRIKPTKSSIESNGHHHHGSHTADATAATVSSAETTPIRINPHIAAESSTRRRKRVSPERRQVDETRATNQPMSVSVPSRSTTTTTATASAVGSRHRIQQRIKEEEAEESILELKSVGPPPKKRATAMGNGRSSQQGDSEEQKTAIPQQLEQQQHGGVHGHSESNGSAHVNADEATATPTAFHLGQLVEVIDRTWRGINKPGGAAWITQVYGDHTYDVRYIIGTRRESHVPDQYILIPSEQIVSLATPGRAVKQHRRKPPAKLLTPPSVDLLGGSGSYLVTNGHHGHHTRPPQSVFLCSGYDDDGNAQIRVWADALGAQVVDQWSPYVTHLIAKCATPKEVAASLVDDDNGFGGSGGNGGSSAHANGSASSRKRSLFKDVPHKRWVKIRSMKYLKALVAGRWIVSEEWLRDCVKQGKRLAETSYEAEGHLRAQNVNAACMRSRHMREEILRSLPSEDNPMSVGTRLFADFCFHIYGEFLSPMPPPVELDTLITIGGGKVVRFIDDIEMELNKPAATPRALVVVCDKLNQTMLRRAAKEFTALPQLQNVATKHVVSYQWVLNSISEAKLRSFN